MESNQEYKVSEYSYDQTRELPGHVDPTQLVLTNNAKQLAEWFVALKQGDSGQALALLQAIISMLPAQHEEGVSAKRPRTEIEQPVSFPQPASEEAELYEDIFLNDEIDEAPITAVILIPNDIGVVSHLIGKQGSSVQEIKRRTGARVQVERTNTVPISAQDRNVFIITNTKSAVLALQMILKKLQEKLPSTVQSIKAVVPNELVSKVIGKGGATIKKLQADTGATMQVQKDLPTDHPPIGRTVFISGTMRQIASAHYQLMRHLVADKDFPLEWRGSIPNPITMRPMQPMAPGMPAMPAAGVDRSRMGMQPQYPGMQTTMQYAHAAAAPVQAGMMSGAAQMGAGLTRFETTVPEYSVSYIIGKKGVFINDMQRSTGTNIEVAKASENGTDRRITVIGPPEGVQRAAKLLEDQVREWQTRSSGQSGPYAAPQMAYHAHPQTATPSHTTPSMQPYMMQQQPQQQPQAYVYPPQYQTQQYNPGQPPTPSTNPYGTYGR